LEGWKAGGEKSIPPSFNLPVHQDVVAINIYFRLIALQIRAQLQYPLAFVFDLTATLLIVAVEFGSLALIFQRFHNIAGWTLGEVAFLYGLVTIAFGAMDILFSGFDPADFGQRVRRGAFDQLLLRPLNITLQVLGSSFVMRRLGKVFQGLIIFGAALVLLDIQWTFVKLLYLPIVLVSLVAFFGGLFIVGSTITFWTVESVEVVNIFTYGGSEMMSYPMHIYQDWLRRFFTFIIPAIFLNYYPALYFLDKADPFNMPPFAPFLAPLAGLGVFGVARAFWHFGIRHYQSTGS
jgi:ABC-2 type transport system permease protein